MDIRINKNNKLPLYLQIKEQIKYLIIAGKIKPGEKLPHRTQLSSFLQVNNRTINNAINELINEGYLESKRGIGTYVKKRNNNSNNTNDEFDKLVVKFLEEATSMGYSLDEIILSINENQTSLSNVINANRYLVFIECNQRVLDEYKKEMSSKLDIEVITFLLDEVEEKSSKVISTLEKATIVVTTFSHLHEVTVLFNCDEFSKIKVVGVTAAPYLEILLEISKLPMGTKLGLFTGSKTLGLRNAIKDARINHLDIYHTNYDDTTENKLKLKDVDYLVLSSSVVEDARKHGLDVDSAFVYKNTLDNVSLEMLRNLIDALSKN